MKNTILALALTAVAMPFAFAAQTAAKSVAKTTTTKKSHKKAVKKAPVKSDSTAAPASSGSAVVKK